MPEIITVNTPFENKKGFNALAWFNGRNFYLKFTIISAAALFLVIPVIFNVQNNAVISQQAAGKITPTPTPTSTPTPIPSSLFSK